MTAVIATAETDTATERIKIKPVITLKTIIPNNNNIPEQDFYCYLLSTPRGRQTYVGATIDPERRLKQHNGEIRGGARATAIKVAQGIQWERVCYLKGIPTWQAALQIEWRWKNLSRTRFKSIKNPVTRRLHALKKLLSLDRPTTKAIPYSEYQSPVVIVWDSLVYNKEYDCITLLVP